MPNHKQNVKRSARGQALVLASLSLFLLALMVVLSFNLSYALRRKTQLQQHSDAVAYSMAVLQARTLNYYAMSNRAIASTYVAMNTVHAYMSAASVTGDMMRAAQTDFYEVAGLEFIECIPCPWTGSACKHCVDGAQALRIASQFGRQGRNYDNKVKGLESSFNKAVKSLDTMMDTIHISQEKVSMDLISALNNGNSAGLDQLRQINAPEASTVSGAVGGMNVAEFNCAIDGKICALPGKPGNASDSTRGIEITEVANAARPDWTVSRSDPLTFLNPQFMNDLMHNIQGEGITMVMSYKGTAKTINARGDSSFHGTSASNNGSMSGAHEHGDTFSQWRHGIGAGTFKAEIDSDKNGGYHTPNGAHTGRHEFEGSNARSMMACTAMGNCFMKFRADSNKNNDFGQPHVYSYITMPLRAGNVTEAPWQLNSSATVKWDNGGTGVGTVNLAANEGAAISKALVYYHRLGNWKEDPNMFNPFWRAKLHPFTGQEAAKVLSAAGQTDAAQTAALPRMPL